MIRDAKIPIAARNFIDRFGKDAPAQAMRRAEELKRAGQADGHVTWTRIYEEVKRLVDGGACGTG